jgi:hypothetical protein
MFAAKLLTGYVITVGPGVLGSNTTSISKVNARVFGTISSSFIVGKSTYNVSPGFAVDGEKLVT